LAAGLLKLTALVLAAIATVYLAVAVTAYALQRKLEYVPDPSSPPLPRGAEFADLEEVELTAADGVKLKAWYWAGGRPLTFVLFHGNAGHRGHRLDWMRQLRRTGAGVFQLDYRGYGGSEGSPTEEGLYADGEAALGWVREHVDGEVVIVGRSLGGGVAVELAARHAPAALVLENASLSAAATAQHAYPFLPVRLLMKDPFDSSERVAEVRAPVLSIHGEHDRIIPIGLGRALFEAAPEPKSWWTVLGAGHNDLLDVAGEEYLARLTAFLELHGAL
jgi:hypothetical protein